MSSKDSPTEAILANFTPWKIEVDEIWLNPNQTTAKLFLSRSSHFWYQTAVVLVSLQHEKTFTYNLTTDAKKDYCKKMCLKSPHQHKEVKEKLCPVSFIFLDMFNSKIFMHLKNFKFFIVFAGHKHISGTGRATIEIPTKVLS